MTLNELLRQHMISEALKCEGRKKASLNEGKQGNDYSTFFLSNRLVNLVRSGTVHFCLPTPPLPAPPGPCLLMP